MTVGMTAQQPTRPNRGRILVVDDHDEWRPLMETILSEEGHEVVLAESDEHALRLASSSKPDIVLLGLSRWDVNSTRAARLLRAIPGLDRVPIILITSKEIPAGCNQSPAPLINGYVNRSQVFNNLAACIKSHLAEAFPP